MPHVDLGILFETIRQDVIEHTKSCNPSQAPLHLCLAGSGLLHERRDPAAYLLGYMYEYGVGVPLDLAQARIWLEKAAAAKTPYGESELAAFFKHLLAGPADSTNALSLYEAAPSQGYAKVQAHLAEFLMAQPWSQSAKEKHRRGVDLMRQAPLEGYPYAMFAVALRGDPAERPAYLVELRQVADAGNADGNQWLCELAASRGDYSAAVSDCKVAARVGLATAQARLAIAYHGGAAIEKADDQAVHWAKVALFQTVLEDKLRAALSFAN